MLKNVNKLKLISSIVITILFLLSLVNLLSTLNVSVIYGIKIYDNSFLVYKSVSDYFIGDKVITYDSYLKKSYTGYVDKLDNLEPEDIKLKEYEYIFTKANILGKVIFTNFILGSLFRYLKSIVGIVTIYVIPLLLIFMMDRFDWSLNLIHEFIFNRDQ